MSSKIRHIIKRTGNRSEFDIARIQVAIYKAAAAIGGKDRAKADRLAELVVKELEASGLTEPSVEDVQDTVERVLIHEGHAATAKSYILYRFERHRMRGGELGTRHGGRQETIPWKLLWRTLVWNQDHDCDTLEGLNRWVQGSRLVELMREADEEYERQLDATADAVLNRGGVRLLVIAGPSSSGKTTTTMKLAERLAIRGCRLVTMNLDNYFRHLELHPRDGFGDYDYETPEAMDLPLINRHLEQLFAGQAVMMPRYDFVEGRQHLNQTALEMGRDDVLLLDTLHGLYPPLTQAIPRDQKFFVYIETFAQVRPVGGAFMKWTDLRLMRRMVRDAAFRGHSPGATLGHWHYVRRGEMKHIIPHLSSVDFIINGAIPYELPFLKRHIMPYLSGIVDSYRLDGRRHDAVVRGERLVELLSRVDSASPDQEREVGARALLREFVGGSQLKY